ncbi:MAG: hypothetical protein IH608_00935, partial [Proteobacteria bacterium]|nr:hypothetical protein [Pseudomonadota bacterium]
MNLRSRLCACAVLALCTSSLAAAEVGAGVRLLAPPESAVVHAPDVLLVYTTPTKTAVTHRVDGAPVDLSGAAVPGDDEDLHHVRLDLDEGTHEVQVLDAGSERQLLLLTVTYVPPSSLRTAALSGAKPYAFHGRERESSCSGCHNLPEVFETVADRPFSPAGKVCGACHPRIEAHPSLHGPVAVYACFMCHEPEYQPTRFTQKSSQAGLCSTCHESFLSKILGGRKYVHGPVAAGACLICHDPHGATTPDLVREETGRLCLRCHAETLPLPVERSLHGKVPCSDCHNPHGGQTPALTATQGNAFCARCHPQVAETTAGHPIDGHPVSADADPSRPGKPLG